MATLCDGRRARKAAGVRRFGAWAARVMTGAGLWVFIGAMGIYTLTGGFYSNFVSDGDVLYTTTHYVAVLGTVAIPRNPGLPQIVPGANGEYFSKYGLGQPLAAAPLHLLGRALAPALGRPGIDGEDIPSFLVRFLPIIATALTVWLVYLFAKGLYGSVRVGVGVALLYALATSAWPYTRFFFTEPLFGLCTFAAAFAMFAAGRAERGRWAWLALAGFALGYALLTKISGVALLPAYAAYLWLIQRRDGAAVGQPHVQPLRAVPQFLKEGAVMVAAALPAIALLLAHNYWRFGNIFDNGYQYEEGGFDTPIWVGLYGFLLSPGKSVFLYSPVLAALPFAVRGFWRRWRAEAVLLGGVIGPTLGYYCLWYEWWGGWCWGPRFLVPVLPFAVLPLGLLVQRSRLWVALIWLVLFPAGVAVQVLGILPDFNTYMIAATNGGKLKDSVVLWEVAKSPLLAHWRAVRGPHPDTVRGMALETLGLKHRPALLISTTAWLCYIGATFALVYRTVSIRKERKPL